MKFIVKLGLGLCLLAAAGCNQGGGGLVDARQGFQTNITSKPGPSAAAPVAPPAIFSTITYPAKPGNLKAYVSPDPKDGKKHPAIVWITGGDSNSIGELWEPASPDNDQTAAQYRQAGIVLMFPSLRGGNDNPGVKEGFLGEVDDILAATDWLAKQPYVDSSRIYLGGHSTGGTLAMLVAECSARYRGTFAFGPVGDVSSYGADSDFLPIDIKNEDEVAVRSPGYWMDDVQSPLWAIEGSGGNIESLEEMRKINKNSNVQFLAVQGADHFNVLAPTNRLIAQKIVADTGSSTNLTLTAEELTQNFTKK